MTEQRPSRRLPGTRLSRSVVVGGALVVALAGCSSTPTITEVTSATTTKAQSSTSTTSGGRSSSSVAPKSGTSSTALSGTSSSTSGTTGSSKSSSTSSTTKAEPGGARKPACDLFTKDDAAAAFGEPVVQGEHRSDECWWESGGAGLKRASLKIDLTVDWDAWRKAHENSSWEPFDLGEEAFAGKAVHAVEFRVADVLYILTVTYSTAGDSKTISRDLARLIFSRL